MTATLSADKPVKPSYRGNRFGYEIIRGIIVGLMHVLYRYRAYGRENIPEAGPTILVLNHLHFFDPGAVVPVLRQQIVTLAAGKWKRVPIWGTILRIAGTIFVRRGEVDRQALRDCIEVLNQGGVLGVAPEGTRSRQGHLQRAKTGVAYLAMRTDAVLVPVAIRGIERISDWAHLRRPHCDVIVGRPFRLRKPEGKVSSADLQEMADQVMVEIGRLLPTSYRGVYAERIAAVEAGREISSAVMPV